MSNVQHDYDIAFLGGGCTALNFALAFAKSNCNHSVIILETRENYIHDRNWSFWLKRNDEFQHRDILRKTWDSWVFSDKNETRIHSSDNYEYSTIASGDFYRKAIHAIEKDERQTIILGCSVNNVSKNQSYKIETSKGIYKSKIIVDTRNKKESLFRNEASFYQIFFGYEVETKTHYFDETKVSLMEYMQNIEGGISFIYTLPFSKTQALIEYTLFTKNHESPDSLEDILRLQIDKKLGQNSYRIISKEKAVLPMGQLRIKNYHASETYLYAGICSGALKESSGYGFMRIHNWTKNLVKNLKENKNIVDYKYTSPVNQFLDRHLIKVLKNSPESSNDIFMVMAHRTNADTFARFMSEKHSFLDLVKIIMAVPKLPFIKALVQK